MDFKDIKRNPYSKQTIVQFLSKMKSHLWGVNPVTWEIASLKFKFPHAKTNSFGLHIGQNT